jgi:exopolysaccharide biosynthesis protein
VFPTFVPVASDGVPVASIEYDNTWRPLKPGLDYALVRGRVGRRDELLVVLRADAARLPIRVRYDKDRPRLVREWFDQEQADAVINANFFLDDKSTAGLLIANGAPFGASYRGFGGMLSIRNGQVSVQWLRNTPYQPDPAIEQAVQGAPMLVLEGRVVPGITDNGERNRRSFAGVDRNGWMVIGVSQTASWSLTDLATFLSSARLLNVRNAVNLDGGASSGLWVRGTIDPVLTNSIDTVPSVIVIGGPPA